MSGRIGRTGTEPSAFRLQSFGMTKMFRFSRRGTALLVLILLMTGRMAARTPHFARFFNVSLPYAANEVEQVWQDRQGMVWLITRQGVFTYDGYSTRKITGGSFWTAAALNRDILILGGDDGLRFLDIRTERLCSPLGNVPQTGEIRVVVMSGGVLYAGTKSNGLFSFDTRRRLWQRYMVPGGKDNIIYAIRPVGNGVYIGHLKGLSFVDGRGNIRDTGIHDNVYSIDIDRRRRCLWVGTEHGLLYRSLVSGKTARALSGSTYNHPLVLPDGNLLVASEYGMLVFNPESGSRRTVSHDVSSPLYSLPSNRINSFFRDRRGNIWISTDRGAAFARQADPFEYTRIVDMTRSNEGNTFTNVLETADGEKWLGGENGILHVTGRGCRWFRVGSGLKKNMIRHIYEDRDHDIWIATDASIARYDRQADRFDYFTLTGSDGRNSDWAYALFEDDRRRLWVATYMGGLYVVDKKALLRSGGTYRMPRSPFGKDAELVSTAYRLVPDGSGHLWTYTGKGLVSIDTRSFRVSLRRKMFLDGMTVARGSVWIDVQGRLYRYEMASGRYTDTGFSVDDGMIYAFVNENARVWMSTSEGLFYIDLHDNTVHSSGKPEYRFTAGTYVGADRSICWGGQDVVARQRISDGRNSRDVDVYVTGISVDGRAVGGIVPRFATDIRLGGRKNISIFLSTYDYGNGSSEVLWYRLGDGSRWMPLAAGTNSIALPALPGGACELYVSVGPRSGSVRKYTLRVPYPWYRQWWAWLLYLLSSSSLVYAVFSFYRRRAQQELRECERENAIALTEQKMDFFVEMSHEVKTPLSLIIAPLEKLLSETTNARFRGKLRSIHGNAMRLSDIINRILDFKRMEVEGDDRILDSHVDFVSLVGNCVREFSDRARDRQVSLSFHSSVETLWMDVDIVKIQSVVRNLLSNAAKYVDDRTGRITVSVGTGQGCVTVSVADNGPGVPAGELRRIFYKYYKGDSQHDGTGLGLAVARKYVELHGGTIAAENAGGLRVTFSIPVGEAGYGLSGDGSRTGDADGRPTVLVVDDNHDMVDFLKSALNENYRAMVAYSGEEAMEHVAATVPDIIITDQMMPGMDGTELCRRLRHNYATADTPIIMLTAKDDQTTELKSISCGADVFIPKPFNLQKLQLHMVQLLRRKASIVKSAHIVSIAEERQGRIETVNDDERLMTEIMKAINGNMSSEEFNVSRLCELIGIEQKQLYRKMKSLTGQTPVSFIREQRLKRAAMLLGQGQLTVSEVMYKVGFSSLSYFNKCFTGMYKVSPKEYKGS